MKITCRYCGNLTSSKRACEHCGANPINQEPEQVWMSGEEFMLEKGIKARETFESLFESGPESKGSIDWLVVAPLSFFVVVGLVGLSTNLIAHQYGGVAFFLIFTAFFIWILLFFAFLPRQKGQ